MWPLTPKSSNEAYGGKPPPARRLLLVAEWVARGFMVEGGGWVQPAFLEAGALGRRGELSESRIVALVAFVNRGSFEARRAHHRPAGCS